MRKLVFAAAVVVLTTTALTLAATNVTELYPGNLSGWGIPGPPPHGNGGGWKWGTTTDPTFADGSSGTKTSPGDGRGSLWWGNDGGTGDQLVGLPASGTLDNVRVDSIADISFTQWRNSTSPAGGAVHPYVCTSILLLFDGPIMGASAFGRIESKWIEYGKYDQTTFASVATTHAAKNDQWYLWNLDPTDQVIEFDGNVPGTSFASDAWDGTGGHAGAKGKLVSLNQLLTLDPDLYLTSTPRNTTNPNGGGLAQRTFELVNNIYGNRHDTWWDNLTFTFAGSSTPVTGADGDANGDGVVNILDLSILSGNWQATTGAGPSAGDFNSDGTVNILDLSIMSGNWQATAVGSPGSTEVFEFTTSAGGSSAEASLGGVPEPGTMLLLAAGASLMLVRRRRA